jgi:hypothetical protein
VQPDHEARPQPGSLYSWAGLPSDGQSAGDYPLSGVCVTCSRFIERPQITDPWRHRTEDAAPVTGPAQGW